MRYTTDNLVVSLTKNLSVFFRQQGWDILWATNNTTSIHTTGTLVDVLTICTSFPTEPRFISRLKGDSAGKEDILVPALTLYAIGSPVRVRSLGLGHLDSEWSRAVTIEAVAETDAQQRALMDLLHIWLMDVPHVALPILDYTIPSTPVVLDPVYVEDATINAMVIPQPFDAVRFIVRADLLIFYFE